jgi:hypothetical protein
MECAITGIIGIYSDLRHVILCASNGEVRQDGLSRMSAAARPRHNLAQDSQREASR